MRAGTDVRGSSAAAAVPPSSSPGRTGSRARRRRSPRRRPWSPFPFAPSRSTDPGGERHCARLPSSDAAPAAAVGLHPSGAPARREHGCSCTVPPSRVPTAVACGSMDSAREGAPCLAARGDQMSDDTGLRGGLWDADNHYYETRDCFTRYLDPEFAGRTVQMVTGEDGAETHRRRRSALHVPRRRVPRHRHEARVAPRDAQGDGERRRSPSPRCVEAVQPEYVERDARLALMDRQGVEAIMLFPTLAVCVEHFLKHDADLLYASFHAFNRWLDDQWGFDHEGRIFAVPLLSLLDVDRAVARARVRARRRRARRQPPAGPGVRPLTRRPARSTRFWARVNEARIPVCFHIGESGLQRAVQRRVGRGAEPVVAPSVGVPVDELLRGSPDHGHVLRAGAPQPVRPVPRHPMRQRRERVAVGAVPAEGDEQDERHGSQRPVARRPDHRATRATSSGATCSCRRITRRTSWRSPS